jgi:hypothetical protein
MSNPINSRFRSRQKKDMLSLSSISIEDLPPLPFPNEPPCRTGILTSVCSTIDRQKHIHHNSSGAVTSVWISPDCAQSPLAGQLGSKEYNCGESRVS